MSNTKTIWQIRDRYFSVEDHPYPIFERKLMDKVNSNSSVLELGCGRLGGLLNTLKGKAACLIGVDRSNYEVKDEFIWYVNNNIENMKDIKSSSIDIVYSRSVMEHIQDIDAAYSEINRVLRTGGVCIFLTPNFFDYGSMLSFFIPNRFHSSIVKFLEGRNEQDTFPVYYKSNTRMRIARLSKKYRFCVDEFQYLGQYPSYLLFNKTLFLLGCKYENFLRKYRRLWFLRGWILCTLRKVEDYSENAR